jgi:hypothetical protein
MTVTDQLNNSNSLNELLQMLADDGRISPELTREIQAGNIKLRPKLHYIRADVSSQGGGRIDLLKAGQDKETGTSTFDGQKLPNGKAFIGVASRALYGVGDDEKSVDWTVKLPGVMQGSHFIVKSDNQEVYELSGSVYTMAGSNTKPDDQFFRHELPIFLPDAQSVELIIDIPKGVAFADNTGGKKQVEYAIYGYETVRK